MDVKFQHFIFIKRQKVNKQTIKTNKNHIKQQHKRKY